MKALIPAAGLGTRWHPWSKVIPKELLPIGNYPAIHYILEETVAAGIRQIGIIISDVKRLIKVYVDAIWKVNHREIKIVWFYQPSPRGVGDALLCAKNWVRDKATAVLYPDIIHPVEGGMAQIFEAFQKYPNCYLGLTNKKPNRRHISYAIEKSGKDVFKIYGPYHGGSDVDVAYGTGRYILQFGFNYVQENFSNPIFRTGQNSMTT